MGKGQRALKSQQTKQTDSFFLKTPPTSNAHYKSPFNQEGIRPGMMRRLSVEECKSKEERSDPENLPDIPIFVLLTTYLSYMVLLAIGYARDSFGRIFKSKEYKHYFFQDGYAPIVSGFESLYHRRLYRRIRDCFQRPITGVASRTIKLLDRKSADHNRSYFYTQNTKEFLNLSSYNYLGFSQSEGACVDQVIDSIKRLGVCSSGSVNDIGKSSLCKEAESLVARFVGKPSSLIISQGFSTNSTILPVLVSKGSLVISDELNHSSIVFGARLSGSSIKVYKHNNMKDLEQILIESIVEGQPKTHRPWKNILLVIEGLYSMEGSIAQLPKIVELKKKYKFYIYMDEAHSIGAMGPRGRGICDYYGIDPSNIDLMMGTFTKSFGSAGGYIAADEAIISKLKIINYSHIYGETVSVPVLQQVISSMKIIMGEDNTDEGQIRLESLAFNSRYFSLELRRMGFTVYGNLDSPIVPLLLFHPAKIAGFSRMCMERGIAVVAVSYPATPLLTSRVRFCLSASHTKNDLDWALKHISAIGDSMYLKNLI